MTALIRIACLALLVVATNAPVASAQEWAKKMFTTTEHDFGTVARGAKADYRFQLKNIYKETVHIASVRSSCGCSTPEILTPTLKTYEVGEILVAFNTGSFLGQKSATITVTIDQPYYAEVQLQVQGFIRGDVVVTPGSVQFGDVEQGTSSEKHVSVQYLGSDAWQLSDVQGRSPFMEVELKKLANTAASYDLLVRLKPDAPPGYLHEQVYLVANDASAKIPVAVEGRVVSAVTVSPSSLYLGELKVGEEATKQLVVKAKAPFEISEVKCDDPSFAFKAARQAKPVHLVSVTFKPTKPGKYEQLVGLKLNGQDKVVTTFTVLANVTGDATTPGPEAAPASEAAGPVAPAATTGGEASAKLVP